MCAMKTKMKKMIRSVDNRYYTAVIRRAEHLKIRDKKDLWMQVGMTREQISEIQRIWGEHADTRWHRYYQYFTGKFDPRYVPEIFYSCNMELVLNPRKMAKEMEDKARIPILYGSVPDLKIPKTIVLNASGIFYDGEGNVLSKTAALALVKEYLEKHSNAILKPTRETNSGKGVVLLDKKHFDDFMPGENFIIQEQIVNQEDIRRLNPDSLNTMRIMTYICKNRYWCAPVVLRIGNGTSHLDNAHSGGVFIGVGREGELQPYAFSEYGNKYQRHPHSGLVFHKYKLSGVDSAVRAAIACHKRNPHMRMVSWDLTLDREGSPVLIEANLTNQSVWIPQIAHGEGVFGDHTEDMLEECRNMAQR